MNGNSQTTELTHQNHLIKQERIFLFTCDFFTTASKIDSREMHTCIVFASQSLSPPKMRPLLSGIFGESEISTIVTYLSKVNCMEQEVQGP